MSDSSLDPNIQIEMENAGGNIIGRLIYFRAKLSLHVIYLDVLTLHCIMLRLFKGQSTSTKAPTDYLLKVVRKNQSRKIKRLSNSS